MTLDISTISIEGTQFAWIDPIIDSNRIEQLVISEEQAQEVFGNPEYKWKTYRGIPLRIKRGEI